VTSLETEYKQGMDSSILI